MLYFIDITISPFTRYLIALVKPHPGHGIENKLFTRHTLIP